MYTNIGLLAQIRPKRQHHQGFIRLPHQNPSLLYCNVDSEHHHRHLHAPHSAAMHLELTVVPAAENCAPRHLCIGSFVS